MIGKKILLIEPGYRNKYPPLGLMKISSYHKNRGDSVKFIKGEDKAILSEVWDRVYVTTLFSFEWKRTANSIDFAIIAAGYQPERVFVGGIAASLMYDSFIEQPQWAGVRFIAGLLDQSPVQSLQLSIEDGDFGVEDIYGIPIEERVPDYSILEQIEYLYPVRDAYFGYASRGCVRKCKFCGVPKLEGAQREMPPLSNLVYGVSKSYGEKKDLVLMDNNVTASSRYSEVIAEIRDLGFARGAKLLRNKKRIKRRVDFNQGIDARILAKSPVYLKEMATICIDPLRIAFDNLGFRKVYDTSVRMAADNGLTSLSNYMLYNFMDTPADLYIRMRLNINLNEELGIRIWSFPMRYQPVTLKDRSHVGKNWNSYYLRNFQLMLQATHGVVSGNPSFFDHAYGESLECFLKLLGYPHGMIFHRNFYEFGQGASVREEYEALRSRMSSSQNMELLNYLCAFKGSDKVREEQYGKLANSGNVDPLIREILLFHTIGIKGDLIDDKEKILIPVFSKFNPDPILPAEDEFVEDAGLYDHNSSDTSTTDLPVQEPFNIVKSI